MPLGPFAAGHRACFRRSVLPCRAIDFLWGRLSLYSLAFSSVPDSRWTSFTEDPVKICNADGSLLGELCAPAMEEGLETIKAITPVFGQANTGCEHTFS